MAHLTIVAGSIVETQRFINVPMRFGERYLARERREVWLRGPEGRESRWVIHTRVLPARRGHRVVLVVRKTWVVGLVNVSTGVGVNYPRIDPPFLLRGFDLLAIVGLAIALPVWFGAAGFVLLLPSGVVYVTIAVCIRLAWRWWLRCRVDKALEEIRAATALQRLQRES
jgi:hypothetical protein